MPYKDKDKQKQAQHDHYLKNKTEYAARVKKYKRINVEYVRYIKESNPCTDCDRFYPYFVMDFHHLKDKEFEINHMMRNTFSLKRIKKEIENVYYCVQIATE